MFSYYISAPKLHNIVVRSLYTLKICLKRILSNFCLFTEVFSTLEKMRFENRTGFSNIQKEIATLKVNYGSIEQLGKLVVYPSVLILATK